MATMGVDSTVNPEGSRLAAASFEASDGPSALCTAWAAACVAAVMVMARRTDAASTVSVTRLCATPAPFAKDVMIESRTLAV